MRDVLKGAKFGDMFVTKRGWKAIYLGLESPKHTDIHVLAVADYIPYQFVKKYNVHGSCMDAMNGNGCIYDIISKWKKE